jgi:hypothetical protein
MMPRHSKLGLFIFAVAMACNHQRLIQDDCAALLFTMRYDDQIALIERPRHYLPR